MFAVTAMKYPPRTICASTKLERTKKTKNVASYVWKANEKIGGRH